MILISLTLMIYITLWLLTFREGVHNEKTNFHCVTFLYNGIYRRMFRGCQRKWAEAN